MEKTHIYIDIRRPEEYATGHIPDAKNLNVEDELAFVDAIRQLADMYDITLYCQSSFRSSYAQSFLAAKYGLAVGNMAGGLSLYQGALAYD